jgi:rare lipoprotein A
MTSARLLAAIGLLLALSACGTAPKKSAPPPDTVERPAPKAESPAHGPKRSPYAPAQEDPSKRGDYVAGGLYAPHVKDSVPEEMPDVDAIPEPEVKHEPRSKVGNRSYAVLGKRYHVRDSAHGYVEEGRASYYGRKFHGRLTSNQEVYDMYAFTAAHKSLPLPSYVRVTNLDNGKSVVVRVNDRGPFHAGRVIDLSYAAAAKLGFVKQGTARVEVRALVPDGDGRELAGRDEGAGKAASPAAVPDNSVRADEFERWMQEKGIRFASGTSASGASASGTPGAADTRIAAVSRPAGGGPLATAETAVVASAAPVATVPAAITGDGVLLQLASFSARDNAERAQGRLRDAGVESSRIDEGQANGQPVWRLRVGPVPKARVAELSARAADLGFDTVQVVPVQALRD